MLGLEDAAQLHNVFSMRPRKIVAECRHRNRAKLTLQRGKWGRHEGVARHSSDTITIRKCLLRKTGKAQARSRDAKDRLINLVTGNCPSLPDGESVVPVRDLMGWCWISGELHGSEVNVICLGRSDDIEAPKQFVLIIQIVVHAG